MKILRAALVAPLALALLLAVAPLTAGHGRAQTGSMMSPPLDQLSGDDFDKAFLMQMSMHHAMAIMMARPAEAQAAHQETKDLARTIIDDQTKEIAQMRTWARDWYGLDLPDPVAMMDQMHGGSATGGMGDRGMMGGSQGMGGMSGMPGHEGISSSSGMSQPGGQMGNMPMMGDMSMMDDLWKLSPQRLEVVFMTLMIPHHQSATDMANLVPDRASHQELKDLAGNIIRTQGEEISTMNSLLASWYGL